MTKNRILGSIGVLWGGGILISKLAAQGGEAAGGAYAAGQSAALVLGALLAIVGLYYLVKG